MGNKNCIWLPLIFSIVLIGGMYFGFKLREYSFRNRFLKDKKFFTADT
jgi:hypothetical protein